MIIADLLQGTDPWKKWRNTGLGASEASVLMGLNPYKSYFQLYQEKRGLILPPDLSRNPHVRRGVRLEPIIRLAASNYLGEELKVICAEHDKYRFIKSSYDGITSNNIPAELKAPCLKQWQAITTEGRRSQAFKMYYPQVQQQIYVADAPHGFLFFYIEDPAHRNGQLCPFKIERDQGFIDSYIEVAKGFQHYVDKGIEPPRDLLVDGYAPKGQDAVIWQDTAQLWRVLHDKRQHLEACLAETKRDLETLSSRLSALMGAHRKANVSGLNVSRVKPKSMDREAYISALEEALIKQQISVPDKSQFKSTGSEYLRITPSTNSRPEDLEALFYH